MNRRSFLKRAGAVGAFTIVPAHILRSETAPSNQLTRALLGTGGIAQSGNHLGYKGTRLIAMCDVDSERLASTAEKAEKAYGKMSKVCKDFREILAMPDVDIVHICTPPHWHGTMSILAAKAGKDIWCEKPMTRTIGEGRRVMEAVKANKRIFRLNTWFRFQSGLYGFGAEAKPLRKAVAAGLLGGPVRVVVGPGQGFNLKFGWTGLVNAAPEPVPANLDYDLWLGPAPFKPYYRHRTHSTFRGYWDYDGGGLGDMGQHYLDPVQYILGKDETSPVRVEYDGPLQHHDAVGGFNRITLTYDDGTQIVLDGNGSLEKEPYLSGPRGKIYPKMQSDIPNLVETINALPDPVPMIATFEDSVRSRRPFALNEQNGFRSCTLVNLGIISMRLGRGFNFDPVRLESPGDLAANRFICQQMRSPWQI